MKIKVLLLALGCTMGTLGAYAQKGVDNGTPVSYTHLSLPTQDRRRSLLSYKTFLAFHFLSVLHNG